MLAVLTVGEFIRWRSCSRGQEHQLRSVVPQEEAAKKHPQAYQVLSVNMSSSMMMTEVDQNGSKPFTLQVDESLSQISLLVQPERRHNFEKNG